MSIAETAWELQVKAQTGPKWRKIKEDEEEGKEDYSNTIYM